MMLHVIKFINEVDNEKYGYSYLINLQNDYNYRFSKTNIYAYSPKCDCYIKSDLDSIQFAYFLDEKGRKYDKFLKRIKDK